MYDRAIPKIPVLILFYYRYHFMQRVVLNIDPTL